jgi:hypothetical protein
MPIVIRELVIRAHVESESRQDSAKKAIDESPADLDRLVSICVEKTLQILERKKER